MWLLSALLRMKVEVLPLIDGSQEEPLTNLLSESLPIVPLWLESEQAIRKS